MVIWKGKEMFYLTTYSTHFIYGYMERKGNVLFNNTLNTFYLRLYGKKGNVLFNNTLNTFYLRLYGVGHMVQNHSDSEREETHCRHMGYSFRLAARVLLYAPSHRQDSTYHSLCYKSRGVLGETRYSSMGPPWRIDAYLLSNIKHLN